MRKYFSEETKFKEMANCQMNLLFNLNTLLEFRGALVLEGEEEMIFEMSRFTFIAVK